MPGRPPDPDKSNPLPSPNILTQRNLINLSPDATTIDQRVNGSVQNFASTLPTPATDSSVQNRGNINRQFCSSSQQTPVHGIIHHSNIPVMISDDRDFTQKSTPPENSISEPNHSIPNRGIDSMSPKTQMPTVSTNLIHPVTRIELSKQSGELHTGQYGTPAIQQPSNAVQNKDNLVDTQFPKLTTNFDRTSRAHRPNPPSLIQNNSHVPPTIQQLRVTFNDHTHTTLASRQPSQSTQPNLWAKAVSNVIKPSTPNPPNITPSYATRLRASQPICQNDIDIHPPLVTTKQGFPAVLFNRDDFMVKLASACRYTLIGKFSSTMPKMEVIRKSLTSQLQIKGNCKVTHFNSTHVYIDLENELDHAMVWNKERIFIEGRLMRLLVWTPTFTPDEETPIAPVWLVLPQLPWHCYTLDVVSKLLAPVGKVLFFDAASIQRTRGSVAKVKIEIDLSKSRPPHIWLGFPQEDGDIYGEGRWQELQFEDVPDYCLICKHQGHSQNLCKSKIRLEEYQNKKKEQDEKERAMIMRQNSGKGEDTGPLKTHVLKTPNLGSCQNIQQTGSATLRDLSTFNNQLALDDTNVQRQEINHSKKKQAVRGNPPVQKQQYVAKNTGQVHSQKNSKGGEDLVKLGICVDYHAVKPHELTVHNPVDQGLTEWHSQNPFDVLAGKDNNAEPTLILNSAGAISDANRGTQQPKKNIAATDCGEPDVQGQMLGFSTVAYLQEPCSVSSGMNASVSTPPCNSGAVQLSKSLGDVVATENQQRLLLDIPISQTATVPRTAEHMQTFAPYQNSAAKDSNSAPLSGKKQAQQMKNIIEPDDEYVTEKREFNSVPRLCTKLRDAIVHHCVDGENRQHSQKVDDVRNPSEQCAPNLIPANEHCEIIRCNFTEKLPPPLAEPSATVTVADCDVQLPQANHLSGLIRSKNEQQRESTKSWIERSFGKTEDANTDALTIHPVLTSNEEVIAVTKNLPQETQFAVAPDAIVVQRNNEKTIKSKMAPHSNEIFGATHTGSQSEQAQTADLHPSSAATRKKKSKKKPGKNASAVTTSVNTVMKESGEQPQVEQQQTEEEVRKAKIRAWQDAILAKSYAENPVIESNIGPLNVLENKAADSIPSQESFDPAYAIPMGRDYEDTEKDRALTEYVSPAHSGNKLIPTARLEVICKEASKAIKEVGRGFYQVTSQAEINNEGLDAPAYFLGDLFDESHNDQTSPSKKGKSKWNLNAPLFIPNALRQQESQVATESVDSQKVPTLQFPNAPSDEVLLKKLDLHDIRGLLQRQNSPPQELPQKFSSAHPGIIEDGSEYEDEDEESTAYNYMEESRHAGLSPRLDQVRKPKVIKKKRRPLELKKKEEAPKKPKRVQPTRSSKSKSARA